MLPIDVPDARLEQVLDVVLAKNPANAAAQREIAGHLDTFDVDHVRTFLIQERTERPGEAR